MSESSQSRTALHAALQHALQKVPIGDHTLCWTGSTAGPATSSEKCPCIYASSPHRACDHCPCHCPHRRPTTCAARSARRFFRHPSNRQTSFKQALQMTLQQALLHLPPVLDKTVPSEYSSKPRIWCRAAAAGTAACQPAGPCRCDRPLRR